jgi:hypothetical protein
MAEDLVKLDEFITNKRKAGEGDAMISEELVALGWDRTTVLRQLAGGDAPQSKTILSATPTSQTGNPGVPLQIENVQYNVNVGKVRSKVGLAILLFSVFAWILSVFVTLFLLDARQAVIPSADDVGGFGVKESFVLLFAISVPLVPLLIFSYKRTLKNLAENAASYDDLFFKRTVRINLVLALILGAGWIVIAMYNILDLLVLGDKTMTAGTIVNSFIFALCPVALLAVFWMFQRKTKR